MQVSKSKSFLGAILLAAVSAIGVLITQEPHPLNLRSHELQCLIIHCTASPEGRNTRAYEFADYFTRPVSKGGKGWSKPGYSDVIELDGTVVNLVPYNEDSVITWNEVAYGAAELNGIARNISYVGGMNKSYTAPKNTLTIKQDSSLKRYVCNYLIKHPSSWVAGHNQFVAKACPSFDVPSKLRSYGIPEQNIYKKPILPKRYEKIYNSAVRKLVASDSI
jgi:N-acetylmuramoyl-L-alanine amidase